MTSDLAEICGIHAGDGYMRKRGNSYEFELGGDFDEKEYYDTHVVPLFENYFNIKIKAQYFKTKGTYGFRICKKEIVETLHSCGFPFGKKTYKVSVPKQILESNDLEIIYRFIRGVFDTDGTLSFKKRNGSGYKVFLIKRHTSPTISFVSSSKSLRDGVAKLLSKTGFHFSLQNNLNKELNKLIYKLSLTGDIDLLLWISNIGFKNTIKLNRFLIWKKFGFCPPQLNILKQKSILNGNCNPNTFYDDDFMFVGNMSVLSKRQFQKFKYLKIPITKD